MTDLPIVSEHRHATAKDYLDLMKPRIMLLVVFTAVAGLIAAPAAMHPVMAVVSVLAVAMGSGAAGALNMWYDADIDAVMSRTSTRPVPAGRVPRDEALSLGIFMGGASVLLMWMASNALAAGLLAVSILYYGVFYTMWLKRRTPQNIVIGGAAGAFPPVIGWAAATGSLALDAWILFAIIFLWTPPHFWSLSLLASKEYAKAGVPMLPVTHGAGHTRLQVLVYAGVLAVAALAPVATGLGGLVYGAVAAVMGGVFLALSVRVARSRAGEADAGPADRKAAASLFAFSILYLFVVFAALMAEHGLGLHWPVAPLLAGGL